MKILIDTHILLWSLFDSKKLIRKEQDLLLDDGNDIFVSVISLWEVSLKYSINKLSFKNFDLMNLSETIRKSGFQIVGLNEQEACSYHLLPKSKHKDPFDKMLITQAINLDFYFLSRDKDLKKYKNFGLKLI